MGQSNTGSKIAKWAYIFFGMIVLAIILAFCYKNSHWVIFRIPVFSGKLMSPFATSAWEMPLARLVALSFLAGFLFALALFHFPYRIRRRLSDRKQERRIREYERELERLRKDVPMGIREDSVVVDHLIGAEAIGSKALDMDSGATEIAGSEPKD